MSAQRRPGPIGLRADAPVIDDGTTCRAVSTASVSIGSDWSGVAALRVGDKLLAAARRTTEKLPAEMREQFAALFSPEAIGITAAVFAAWGASHFFGVGEIADLVLVGMGAVTIGWQVFGAARNIWDFVTIAATARCDADLDAAASHLARAVTVLGVAAFVGLIMKYGERLGGRLGETGRSLPGKLAARSEEDWLAVLGKSKAPPLVRQRLAVALKFFHEKLPDKSAAQVEGYLKGIDFSQDVRSTTLNPGDEVVAYGNPDRLGLFYTRLGTYLDRLGISAGERQFMRFRVRQLVTVLESKTTGLADTWTNPTAKALVDGGGTQLIIPDAVHSLEPVGKP